MTAARKLAPLFDYIETELASAYDLSLDVRAADFLMSQDQMQGEAGELPRASVFVSEKAGDVEIGIYLSEAITAALEEGRPLEGLSMENLDAFCCLVEEISHFHLLVNRAGKGQGVSRLELEWQGEMDKLWLAAVLMRAQTGSSCLPQLASLIFDSGKMLSAEKHYEHALHHARLFWKRLSLQGKTQTPERVRKELRQAYPLHWPHKLRLIHNA